MKWDHVEPGHDHEPATSYKQPLAPLIAKVNDETQQTERQKQMDKQRKRKRKVWRLAAEEAPQASRQTLDDEFR